MRHLPALLLIATSLLACCCSPPPDAVAGARPTTSSSSEATMPTKPDHNDHAAAAAPTPATTAIATFANGCFWCTEAVLEQQPGVLDVTSGYMGGRVDQPTYEQVCSGTTGHAECVQVTFDPRRISYATLLDWFFRSHDPTTLNRQGADEGTQYRSAIFCHDEGQKAAALAAIAKHQAGWRDPIVTEVTAAQRFWPAEDYHQDYFRKHPDQGYCRAVIAPKLKKLGLPAAAK